MSTPPELTSAEEMIKAAPVGTMIYGRFLDRGEWQTGLLVREESQFVRNLGPAPVIAVRAGLIEQGPVSLVALVAELGRELYETWFNYHQPEGPDYFGDLAKQTRLDVFFFTPARARGLQVRNSLAPFFQDAAARIAARPAWSMREFDQARAEVYRLYPSVTDLWDALLRM